MNCFFFLQNKWLGATNPIKVFLYFGKYPLKSSEEEVSRKPTFSLCDFMRGDLDKETHVHVERACEDTGKISHLKPKKQVSEQINIPDNFMVDF